MTERRDWPANLLILAFALIVARSAGPLSGVPLLPLPTLLVAGLLGGALWLSVFARTKVLFTPMKEAFLLHIGAFLFIAYAGSISNYKVTTGETAFLFAPIVLLMLAAVSHLIAIGRLKDVIDASAGVMAIVSIPAVIMGLLKVQAELSGSLALSKSPDGRIIAPGISIVPDYNIFAMIVFLGGLGWLHLSQRFPKPYDIAARVVGFVIIPLPLLSGSRRFIIVFGLSLAAWMIWQLVGIVRKPRQERTWIDYTILVSVSVAVVMAVVGLIASAGLDPNKVGNPVLRNVTIRLNSLFAFQETLANSRGEVGSKGLEILWNGPARTFWLGEGFDYTRKISPEVGVEGWPHNPIVSGWLYGGILSGLLIAVLVVRSAWFSIKSWKASPYAAAFALVVTIFLLVSGNTYYDSLILPLVSVWGYALKAQEDSVNVPGTEPAFVPISEPYVDA